MAEADEIEQTLVYLVKKRLDRPSSTYPALTKLNEPKLYRVIKEKRTDPQLTEYVKKRTYYANKALAYINSVAGGGRVNINPVEPAYVPPVLPRYPLPRKGDGQYKGPDARYITNRYHATQYIDHCFLAEEENNNDMLRSFVQAHLGQQKTWIKKLKSMEGEYQVQVDQIRKKSPRVTEGFHPVKLKKIQEDMEWTLRRLKESHEKKVLVITNNILSHSRQLSSETVSKLRNWDIPFFCTEESYKYPELDKDQEFVLDYLVEKVGE